MSPIRTGRTRKLVLGRETVRTLAARSSTIEANTGEIGIDTSCGEACTCACPGQTA